MKITKVDFSAGGDGVTALYINGVLHTYGDYYHDKIDDWIRGFKDGLKFAKVKFVSEEIEVDEENPWVEEVSNNGNVPPKHFEDIYETAP